MPAPPSAVEHPPDSPARSPNRYSHLAEQFAEGAALVAAIVGDARRRAEGQKASLKERLLEWDDAIRPFRAWAAGTDVLHAAILWMHGLCRNGRGRWQRRTKR